VIDLPALEGVVVISDNPLDTDKNQYIACLLCGGLAKGIFHALPAGSSRADAVHLTSIYECNPCGHIQKHVDDEYKETLEAIYQSSYVLPAEGRKIDFVDGETLSREKSLSRALSTVLAGHRDSAVTSILDFGTGSGHLVPPLKWAFPHAYVVVPEHFVFTLPASRSLGSADQRFL